MSIILGINAFHGDASAALIKDGKLITAVEEERFTRIKHTAGFPYSAINYCLTYNGISISDIEHIAINGNQSSNLKNKIIYSLSKRPNPKFLLNKLITKRKRSSLKEIFEATYPNKKIKAKFHFLDHHLCHLASAYFCSKFSSAALISIDGFGDFASTAWGFGIDNSLKIYDRILFPHSMGIFYTAVTQYLGFFNYGDEYKVMGLSPYGRPRYLNHMKKIVSLHEKGKFELNLEYFRHTKENLSFMWDKGSPVLSKHFTNNFEELLGPSRKKDDEILQFHKDIAASAQAIYEECFFHILNYIFNSIDSKSLAIAGGCGANSVANGKITNKTSFEKVFIHPAPGDAGGAVGAASIINNNLGYRNLCDSFTPYLGGSTKNKDIKNLFLKKEIRNQIDKNNFSLRNINSADLKDEEALIELVSDALIKGLVVGWFYGGMEWGPRALGHRSILGDPRRKDMKDILNLKIKKRESFRPFAPSILAEHISDWFEISCEGQKDVPFMMKVYKFKTDKRNLVPAVCHVDGSGRLQTVTLDVNKRYYKLIKKFYDKTKIPMILNTSFNENEPIVRTAEEALECFLRTKMDMLVLNDYILLRSSFEL